MREEELNALFEEYALSRDVKTRNKIVENYYYMAEIIAKKFANRGAEFDDILSVAHMALIKGVENFDINMGVKFTTFITPTITGMIKNYFRDNAQMLKMPRKLYSYRKQIRTFCDNYLTQNGVKPSLAEIAEGTNLSIETINEVFEYRKPTSLDATVTTEYDDMPIGETIASNAFSLDSLEEKIDVKKAIENLPEKEKIVIKLRFYKNMTQTEVAKILKVSQMFVSRAERRALERLKEELEKK